MSNPEPHSLQPGLYLVATPIGTARDITLRALDIFASADALAAEDTRSLRRLLDIHGVKLGERPLIAYHDHNGAKARPQILRWLAEGKSVAYASEAGTPMIADPGFDLVRAARAAGHLVTSAPGPSAVITALTIAGLPTDRFFFEGFLPNTKSQRRKVLEELAGIPGTLVLYESPKRLAAMLKDAAEVLGGERPAAICRELTKRFEEVVSGSLTELSENAGELTLKGEIVLLIERGQSVNISEIDIDSMLSDALTTMSVRDAADHVAAQTGAKRRDIYQRALHLSKE